MTTKRARDLEREYRAKRQAILDSDASWEAKMREISRLLEQYRRRKNALEESA